MNQADITLVPKMQETWADHCAYCGAGIAEVEYTIHRDGYDTGPQVPLCYQCGHGEIPNINQIWAKIANPEPVIEAIKEAQQIQEIANEMLELRKA